MILLVSDTHSYFQTVNEQIAYAENTLNVPVSCVIHLGDFGIYKSNLHDFFTKQKARFERPLYFIEGNHEDFVGFPWLTKKYKEYFTHLPRCTINTIGGYRFLCLGGADYMDSMVTQQGAVISDKHIDKCLALAPEEVDIILTHDCPRGIGVPNTPGFEHYGETGFSRSEELIAHFKPKLWLFGHHHKWFQFQDSHTAYYGLGSSWRGFGLLDDNFQVQFVKNDINLPHEETLFEKLLAKFKLTRPNIAPR